LYFTWDDALNVVTERALSPQLRRGGVVGPTPSSHRGRWLPGFVPYSNCACPLALRRSITGAHDLQELLAAVGLAAQKAAIALVMFVDELQYVEEDELAALITGLHRDT
jgi:hypothetical protein